MSIVRRNGKMKMKEVEEIKSTSFVNVSHLFKNVTCFPKVFHCSSAIKGFGKPNVTMVGYESNPGVWVFDDNETEITIVIFSDLHRKHPWKGTSVELSIPDDMDEDVDFDEFFNRLENLFIESDKYHIEKISY